MKKPDRKKYEAIEKWVGENARPLEKAMWNYLFCGGDKQTVLEEIEKFQNSDGGFGNAIEPDNWNKNSSPYETQYAARLYLQLGLAVPKSVIDYFGSTVYYSDENGWDFTIPSNDAFPHAPWWNYNEELNKNENWGLTSGVCAIIISSGEKSGEAYRRAKLQTERIVSALMKIENAGDMGTGGFIELARALKESDSENFDTVDCDFLDKLVVKTIEHDISKWEQYGCRPSDLIISSESPYYESNKAIVEAELDYYIDTLPENDVWRITWTWFENMALYEKEFYQSEKWWKAIKAIEHISFLKNFGRISEE